MSDDDIAGDLPPMDPELAAWLASDTAPPMPPEVWARIEAGLAAEPPLVVTTDPQATGAVVDLAAERRRRRGGRVLPILAGAAGVALVGAVVLPSLRSGEPAPVAEGSSTSQPALAVAAPGESEPDRTDGPAVTTSRPAPTQSEVTASEAAATVPTMPRAIVSTGTDYTSDALPAQVVTLLAGAGMSDSAGVAKAMTASPAPETMPGTGLAESPEALADCLTRLGLPVDAVPLVLDTATIDGQAGSVIVTAGESGPDGSPASLHVVAVEQECDEADVLAAQHWDLPLP